MCILANAHEPSDEEWAEFDALMAEFGFTLESDAAEQVMRSTRWQG